MIVKLDKVATERKQPRPELGVGIFPGYDGDGDTLVRVTAACYLRGIASAKSRGARKGEARNALEHRALSGGLVANDHEL